MQTIAHLVVQAINTYIELLVLLQMPPMPEHVEITLNELSLLLVTLFALPIDLGFSL